MRLTANQIRKFFLSITFLICTGSFVIGLYSVHNKRDEIFQDISFTIAFASLLIAIVQAFPNIINHMRNSLRMIMYSFIIVAGLILAPLVTLAFQDPVIKIGVSLPFHGGDRQDAIPILNGINLALNEGTTGRKIGNYTIELVPFDDTQLSNGNGTIQLVSPVDGSDTKDKPVKFTDFVKDAKLAGIIGPFNSGAAIEEIPPTNHLKIPMISPANTADCLTDQAFAYGNCDVSKLGKGTYFRTATVDSIREAVLADYLASQKPSANVVIFKESTDFAKSFADSFSKEWEHKTSVKPTIMNLSDSPGDDLRQTLQQLKTVPDIIVFAGTGARGVDLHRAMQQLPDFANTAFAGAATIMNEGFTTHLKNASSGDVYAVTPIAYNDQTSMVRNFTSRYNTVFGQDPTPYSASAYDATRILLMALGRSVDRTRPPVTSPDIFGQSNAFRTEVLKTINEVNTKGTPYQGVTGTYSFALDGKAEFERRVSIYKFDTTRKSWQYVPAKQDN